MSLTTRLVSVTLALALLSLTAGVLAGWDAGLADPTPVLGPREVFAPLPAGAAPRVLVSLGVGLLLLTPLVRVAGLLGRFHQDRDGAARLAAASLFLVLLTTLAWNAWRREPAAAREERPRETGPR